MSNICLVPWNIFIPLGNLLKILEASIVHDIVGVVNFREEDKTNVWGCFISYKKPPHEKYPESMGLKSYNQIILKVWYKVRQSLIQNDFMFWVIAPQIAEKPKWHLEEKMHQIAGRKVRAADWP